MFISISINYNICKIIDTDFEEMLDSAWGRFYGSTAAAISLIEVYEKRNLPVAANLALFFQHEHNKRGIKISDLIKQNKKYNTKYLKYADEVDKLMIWM